MKVDLDALITARDCGDVKFISNEIGPIVDELMAARNVIDCLLDLYGDWNDLVRALAEYDSAINK